MARYTMYTATKRIRRLKKTTRSLKTRNDSLKRKLRRLSLKTDDLESAAQAQSQRIDRLSRKLRSKENDLKKRIDAVDESHTEDVEYLDNRITMGLAGLEKRQQDNLTRLESRVTQDLDDIRDAHQDDLADLDARVTQRWSYDDEQVQDREQTQTQLDNIQAQLGNLDRRLIEHQDLHSAAAVGLMDLEALAEKVAAIEARLATTSSQVSSAAAAGPSTASSSTTSSEQEEAAMTIVLSLDKEVRRRLAQALIKSL